MTGVIQGVAAKAYRLLRAILNTAVDEDDLIGTTPSANTWLVVIN